MERVNIQVQVSSRVNVTWKKGMRVLFEWDKEAYLGTVTKVSPKEIYFVFDDGTKAKTSTTSKYLLGVGIDTKKVDGFPLNKIDLGLKKTEGAGTMKSANGKALKKILKKVTLSRPPVAVSDKLKGFPKNYDFLWRTKTSAKELIRIFKEELKLFATDNPNKFSMSVSGGRLGGGFVAEIIPSLSDSSETAFTTVSYNKY